MIDLLIRGGVLYDGTGAPGVVGDLAITGDRIEVVGNTANLEAAETIDATGLAVCPGFIDVHSHSDHTLIVGPEAESKVLQGVTTEIVGNCGFSGAPLSEKNIDQRKQNLVAFKLEPDWQTFGAFLDRLDAEKPGLNVAALVGHGTLRSAVMGHGDRAPDAAEQSRMESIMDECMDAGAIGLSTGLAYAPGMFASEEELVKLSAVVARRGGVCTSHLRSESDKLMEAIGEFLRIGEKSGVRLQVSHLKASGQFNWGRAGDAIDLIEKTAKSGVEVAFDRYPYTAACTSLDVFLPNEAHDGGNERMLERLRSKTEGPAIRETFGQNVERHCGWGRVRITSMELGRPHPAEGKNLADYANEMGAPPAEVGIELILESVGQVGMVCFSMDEGDVRQVMAHPWCMIGSDASVCATSGILSQGVPHPRAFGTFPRYLGEYVREAKLIPLEEAIRRLTSLSADHFHLNNRGRLAPGHFADVVIFDPKTIQDKATYELPHQNAVGIDAVIVNGKVAARKGQLTGNRCGKVLR